MTERIPLDHLNSDQLDALYQRIETLEQVAAGNKRHVQLIVPDLERAEAAADRVRTLHTPVQHLGQTWCAQCSVRRRTGPQTDDEWVAFIPHPCPTLEELDGIAPVPAATGAIGHVYLSTGCLHGQHSYCSNTDGIAGPKKPAQCKFCATPCTCHCHGLADTASQPEPAVITDPAYLHHLYAQAIRNTAARYPDDIATAVMRVRDRHIEQLRQRLHLAAAELATRAEADSADAAAGSYALRAETAEQQRDQLAGLLREVLDQFADWPKGGVFWPQGGVVARVDTTEWDRWDAAHTAVTAPPAHLADPTDTTTLEDQ